MLHTGGICLLHVNKTLASKKSPVGHEICNVFVEVRENNL